MDKIFASKPGRKKFLFTIAIIVLLLILVRYWLLPASFLNSHLNEIFSSLAEKFITALVSAVIVGYFLYWIQTDEKKKQVDFTESEHEVEKQLATSRKLTNFWYFNGGLGRYSKSDTIPKLSHISAVEKRTIILDLIVINPFNQELIDKYIDFRRSLESEKKQKRWTPEETQAELLATIATCLYYRRKNQFLNISIRIKNFFTLSRMDISDSVAVITREDPTFPSIIALKGSHMYQHYLEEFQQVQRQSKLLEYEFPIHDYPTQQQVKDCIMAVFPNNTLTHAMYEKVYDKFKNPQSPFE